MKPLVKGYVFFDYQFGSYYKEMGGGYTNKENAHVYTINEIKNHSQTQSDIGWGGKKLGKWRVVYL